MKKYNPKDYIKRVTKAKGVCYNSETDPDHPKVGWVGYKLKIRIGLESYPSAKAFDKDDRCTDYFYRVFNSGDDCINGSPDVIRAEFSRYDGGWSGNDITKLLMDNEYFICIYEVELKDSLSLIEEISLYFHRNCQSYEKSIV